MAKRRIKIGEDAFRNDPLRENGWLTQVAALAKGRHRELLADVASLRCAGKTVYPPHDAVFYALHCTPWDAVRVVIVGQDPYHQPQQAHGLAFSVQEGVAAPRSLQNIFREIRDDVYAGEEYTASTDLTRWAKQGVLLLNTTLTVEDSKANSHAKLGWSEITHDILSALGGSGRPMAFLLWGRHAAQFAPLIDPHHLVLQAAHPSPLSASRGFFGCKHFSKVNSWLEEHRGVPIVW